MFTYILLEIIFNRFNKFLNYYKLNKKRLAFINLGLGIIYCCVSYKIIKIDIYLIYCYSDIFREIFRYI